MKKLLLLITIATFAGGCVTKTKTETKPTPSDLSVMGLIGDIDDISPIKFVLDETKDAVPKVIDDAENTITYFDTKGMITAVEYFDSTLIVVGTKKNFYDEQRNIVRREYVARSGYSQSWKYTFNPQGDVISEEIVLGKDTKPIVTTYKYENGKLLSKESELQTVLYHYDTKGLPLGMEEKTGETTVATTHLLYDDMGTYIGREETMYVAANDGFTVSHFDAKGLLLTEIVDGQKAQYTYNDKGLVISKDTPSYSITYEYIFDDRGNWIEKSQRSKCVDPSKSHKDSPDAKNWIVKRAIEYR